MAADTAPQRIVLPDTVTPTHYDVDIVPDAAKLSFTGAVKIDIDVKTPTPMITLNAADLEFTKVSLDGGTEAPKVSLDSNEQTARFTFAQPVPAGHHVLAIAYRGKIYQHAAGLFALDDDGPKGKRRSLYTQFENSDARRFLPCWDEPALKATFTLTATVPADEMALSNMPSASTEALPGHLKRVHFMQSPKMSSYLLFFGLGDFERLSQTVNGVDVGVVVLRGGLERARYALDAAVHILPYYEEYFGVKYPLPKLDLIAGPGVSQFFGAMENWGAIFYFDRDLLIDPKISTQDDRRRVYVVVAHEMAHQWFGDLVTMAWWDDLWLNEGFASWMEVKATDHFHPEWKLWLDSQQSKDYAMRLDAREGTHPIIQPIRDVLQANEAFDTITYEKGQAVIRMLEDYLGPDAFRAGVRSYIKAHAYGNTVTDDLWRELNNASSTDVTSIAHDFTLQAGVPLVQVDPSRDGVRLTQGRFAVDDSGKAPASWEVPVIARALDSKDLWHGIVSRAKPVDVKLDAKSGVVVNAGQAGYFRTRYAPALRQPLVAGFHGLSAADELGLLSDSNALGYAGYEPLSDFLDLASQATPDMDPAVLDALAGKLASLDTLYDDLPGQAAYRAYTRRVLGPLQEQLGWTPRDGESQNTELLRQSLLRTLSRADDTDVIDGARARFADYLKDPSTLSADLRATVLDIVAEHADAKTWEQIDALANKSGSMLEKQQLYYLLGSTRDKALAARALQLTLTDQAPVTMRPAIVAAVSREHADLAFDFATAHVDTLYQALEPDSRSQYFPRLASGSNDLAIIARLDAFAQAHIPASARRDVVKAESAIRYTVKIRTERLPEVDRWLAAHKA